MRIFRILGVVVVPVIIAGLLSYVKLATEYCISRVDFIVSDFDGKHTSGLRRDGLIKYVESCGCSYGYKDKTLVIKFSKYWYNKEWVINDPEKFGL